MWSKSQICVIQARQNSFFKFTQKKWACSNLNMTILMFSLAEFNIQAARIHIITLSLQPSTFFLSAWVYAFFHQSLISFKCFLLISLLTLLFSLRGHSLPTNSLNFVPQTFHLSVSHNTHSIKSITLSQLLNFTASSFLSNTQNTPSPPLLSFLHWLMVVRRCELAPQAKTFYITPNIRGSKQSICSYLLMKEWHIEKLRARQRKTRRPNEICSERRG